MMHTADDGPAVFAHRLSVKLLVQHRGPSSPAAQAPPPHTSSSSVNGDAPDNTQPEGGVPAAACSSPCLLAAATGTGPPLHLVKMRNRLPHWSAAQYYWWLNFHKNRVKIPSVKNFQLAPMMADDGEDDCDSVPAAAAAAGSASSHVAAAAAGADAAAGDGSDASPPALLFGKTSEDVFVMDFDPRALSCVQAFALSLSNFGSKWCGVL